MLKIIIYLVFFITNNDSNIVTDAKVMLSKYNVPNKKYVVIIDYSKSIDEERLYVVDIPLSKIVLKSTVAHAKNSGGLYPNTFSNDLGTLKSSLGVYQTKGTYNGMWGYSLVIKGLDPGKNSNAEIRHIVFHSNKKMLGKWSWGCFATPDSINRKLIDMIKGGSLVFVHD